MAVRRERGASRPKVPPYFRGIPGAGEVRNDFELPWQLDGRALGG